ncbi:hypothetical protein [Herbaspirillum sp. SJZ107]|uniref:hypothetical protein n=1 Tax=Herbaspirillum sp. SJZ107 TaxID=2572881 RepID=UPI00114F40EB|nr:hypothetical protein [Herbaspirillum sp. SJZ107]TQK10273.1 hypothetical protein FBX97_0189 [Herbaspirillum sp. SJZ107]
MKAIALEAPGAVEETDTSLLITASLRGLRLHTMPGDLYAIYRFENGQVVPVAAWQTRDAVLALLGAKGGISLREAAEREGFHWPDTPAAILGALTRLQDTR